MNCQKMSTSPLPYSDARLGCGPTDIILIPQTMEEANLIFKTTGLFVVTALAEIVGCFLPYL